MVDRTGARNATPEAAAPAKAVRFEGLEAYRGIAALLLVVFHAYQYTREGTGRYAYEGSPLGALFGSLQLSGWFFVLSGFLVSLAFFRAAIGRTGPRSVSRFLKRRALRILPLYYVAILSVWGYNYSGGREDWVNLVQHLTFTQVFSKEHIFWLIGPSWTLALEVQFYLFMALAGPAAYLACGRLLTARSRAAFLAATLAGLGLFSVLYKWWASYVARIPHDDWPTYFGPLASLDTFAMGMMLAVVVAYGEASGRVGRPRLRIDESATAMLRLLGVLLLVILISRYGEEGVFELYFHALSGAAFLLFLAATVLGPTGSPLTRALRHPALVYIGLVSYGIFLWHEPLLIELGEVGFLISRSPDAFPQNALVLVALSIAVAGLSYRFLERPATRLFGRRKGEESTDR